MLQSALCLAKTMMRGSRANYLSRQIHSCLPRRARIAALSRNQRIGFNDDFKTSANTIGFGINRRFSNTTPAVSQEHDGDVFLEDHPYSLDHLTLQGRSKVEWYKRTDDMVQSENSLNHVDTIDHAANHHGDFGEVFLEDHPYTLDHVTLQGRNQVEWYGRTDDMMQHDDDHPNIIDHAAKHDGEVFLEDHPYTLDHVTLQGQSQVEWYGRTDYMIQHDNDHPDIVDHASKVHLNSGESTDEDGDDTSEFDGEVFLQDHPYSLDHLTLSGRTKVEWYRRTDDMIHGPYKFHFVYHERPVTVMPLFMMSDGQMNQVNPQ